MSNPLQCVAEGEILLQGYECCTGLVPFKTTTFGIEVTKCLPSSDVNPPCNDYKKLCERDSECCPNVKCEGINLSNRYTSDGRPPGFGRCGDPIVQKPVYTLNVNVINENYSTSGGVVSANGNIQCGNIVNGFIQVDCLGTNIEEGTQVELLAIPAVEFPDTVFGGWEGDCAFAGTALTCILPMDGNKSVTARFNQRKVSPSPSPTPNVTPSVTPSATPPAQIVQTAEIRLTPDPTNFGSVSMPFGQINGSSVSRIVDVGTQVTITATPNQNRSFVSWTNTLNSQVISTLSTTTITVTRDINLVATFRENTTEDPIQSNSTTFDAPIVVEIKPAPVPEQTYRVTYPFNVKINPIDVNITEPFLTSSLQFLEAAIRDYIDEERELKTLLNYGDDRQSVVLASRYGNEPRSVQLKLLQPVPNEIDLNEVTFLSREVAKTLIDKVRVRFSPAIDATPYLRPKNTYAKTNVDLGKSLKNVTLTILSLETGSVGSNDLYKNVTFEDQIFRRWYTYDFNSSELNIDFTDYNNFVFYGSAAMRLAAFKEKLKLLENIEIQRLQFITGSITGSTTIAGRLFVQEEGAKLSKQKEDIIRGFDRYEQFLYFTPSGSNLPYTASAYYADGGYEYNPVSYWPKNSSGSLYFTYSTEVEDWYTTQSAIAQRFDDFNENNLVNTIPTHIREDENSAAYITFITMIGHFFDLIKPYVDQMSYIYNRDISPDRGLSKDLVNEIAESLGFVLPTINSVYDLSDNILGTTSDRPRRDYTVESYKRLLHNLPFFAKAKGTKTALQAMLRSLGITPQLLDVHESGVPTTSSYYVLDEYTSGIDFDEATPKYLILPLSASRRNPTSLQFNFTVAKAKSMTILNGDDKWALNVKVHPTSNKLGRFELVSGSSQSVILSSSYQEIFGDELLNATIRTYDSGSYANLFITQVYGEDIIFSSSVSEPIGANKFVPLWSSSNEIYLGGSGSLVIGNFDGTIDEVRLWGKNLSDEMVLNTAFDPGSNAGDVYTDPVDYLYVQLSFNIIDTGSLPLLPNESPYKNILNFPPLEYIGTSNTTENDFIRYGRTARQLLATAGSTTYLTNKIRVLPPPVFDASNIDNNGVKKLSRTKSIVTPEQKRLQRGRNKVILATSPTQIINQNIVRNLGYENINAVLGAPTDSYRNFEKTLASLKTYYQKYYYVNVNVNRYIRILSELGSVIDQVVGYFIPSKATLLKGIVIEPNILERVKIAVPKNTRVYGGNTRKTRNAKASLTGSRPDYGATFNLSQTIEIVDENFVRGKNDTYKTEINNLDTNTIEAKKNSFSGKISSSMIPELAVSQNNHKAELIVTDLSSVSASYNAYKASIREVSNMKLDVRNAYYSGTIEENFDDVMDVALVTYDLQHENWKRFAEISQSLRLPRKSRIDTRLSELNKIKYNATGRGASGAEPYNRIYPRKLTDTEINFIESRVGSVIYQDALYDIPPSTDLTDVGVRTYFSQPHGIYYYSTTIKTPAYRRPVNFTAATSWSYGSRYNLYDVVYQDIDSSYGELGPLTGSARAGNGRYYVFTTQGAYTQSIDGTSFYLGSTPSYIPPSLDKTNWDLLRFTPLEKREPKRLVFDTFTVADPSQNNYKITIIDPNRVIDLPDRYVDSFTALSISPNSYSTGQIALQNIAALFAVQSSNQNIRLRLYRTSEKRNADVNRTIDTRPTGDQGVLVDLVFDVAGSVKLVNPIVTLVADQIPPSGLLFYTLDNLNSTTSSNITIFLFYFALEIEPRVPKGYLRKHYRFFRDNSTGTKRRNYLGCKNTEETTIDGRKPIEVFLSEGTSIKVADAQSSTIIPGGGGLLDVT